MGLVLSDIKNFLTVCETRNMTRASEIIGLSQPALSYAIKRLESALGGELFIRLKNGIELTKLGEQFKQRARRLLYEWEQVSNLAQPGTDFVQGCYVFAIHPSVALSTLEFFFPALQRTFPQLDFNLIHGISREMTEKVISWEADFGIVVNPIRHPDLVIHRLYKDEVAIFHTPSAEDKLIYDSQLAQSQHILHKLQKKNRVAGKITSANLEVVAKLTAMGLGYGILPARVASQYPQLKRLADSPVFSDDICLVYRAEKHNNAVSKEIIRRIEGIKSQLTSC